MQWKEENHQVMTGQTVLMAPARHSQSKAEGSVAHSTPISQHHPHRSQPSAIDTLVMSQGAVGKVRHSLETSCSP